MTVAFQVPRNEALARVDPDNVEYWARYVREWTAGNHVRTVGGIVAATALTLSIAS